MNVKKFLKKKAQADLQSVQSENDQAVLQRLKNAVTGENPKTKRNRKWLWAIPSGALACAVAAILIVELVPHPGNDIGGSDPNSGGVKYEERNLEQTLSDISELTNALTDLTLHFTEYQSVGVVKFYDSVSGDDLYFVLTIDESSMEAMYSMRFLIVVNDNYEYDKFNMEGEAITETYPDYSITYTQRITPDPDFGLNLIESNAQIENAKYEMYVVKYQEYSLENGTLLTVINNMLEFHA